MKKRQGLNESKEQYMGGSIWKEEKEDKIMELCYKLKDKRGILKNAMSKRITLFSIICC